MSNSFKTEQEIFWAGEFGDAYTVRNSGDALVGRDAALFAQVLRKCHRATTLIEFGANRGLNLRAIRALRPDIELHAIEINETAVKELRSWGGIAGIYHESILTFRPERTWDIALIKGVLIHISPSELCTVYDALYETSRRYIVLVEYYNPTPVEVSYRGHAGKLFKRDFAGELLDRFPALHVLDYGFVWRRDPSFPQDDITWFLLEKSPERK